LPCTHLRAQAAERDWKPACDVGLVPLRARVSRQQALRVEVVVMINVLGAEWTDIVDSDRLFQPVPAHELTEKPIGVVGLRIPQYPGVFAQRDKL
jgi:hypothetical protein